MQAGGVTELIWHFAGYLQIIDDAPQWRVTYEHGGLSSIKADDFRPELAPNLVQAPDADDLGGTVKYELRLPDAEEAWDGIDQFRQRPSFELKDLSPIKEAKAFVPTLPTVGGGGGGGGGGDDDWTHPPVKYTPGGDDKIIELAQVNRLSDNDGVLSANSVWEPEDPRPVLEAMLEQAKDEIPEDLRLPNADASTITQFLAARDADRLDSGEPHPNQVAPGHYINGELQIGEIVPNLDGQPEESLPDGTPKSATATIDGEWPVGQEAELGGNNQLNAAYLVDTAEASLGMVVMGDYSKTDAIIQINVLRDTDEITLANGTGSYAGSGDPTVVANNNTLTNDAAFEFETVSLSIPNRGPGPVQWNVEFVIGDFYDVKALHQINYLHDNDFSSQTSLDIYSMVSTGDNEQANLVQLLDFSKTYDVIIIGGDYHGANLIFQTNILFDSDFLQLVAADRDGIGSAVMQTALSGENELLNEALIRNIGSPNFQDATPTIFELVADIEAQASSLDPTLAWQILGGSGVLDVLYISGDYYDINVISQINILADQDTASQDTPAGGVIGVDDVTQSVSTGQNNLTNSAAIVDVGTVTGAQYLGGDYYDDVILVQANLVADEDDKVVYQDTNTLVAEVVAFTMSDGEQENQDGASAPVKHLSDPTDIMGNVLL